MGICRTVVEARRREKMLLGLGKIPLQLCNHAQVNMRLLMLWVD